MKEQIILNGLAINYYKFGEGNTILLFLHGWRSDSLAWNQIIADLKDKYSIYALDLPGFGGSATPQKPYTVSDYAAVVADFIHKKNLKNLTLIGHSVGGRISIKLAASRPELVGKLVLVDSAGFVTTSSKVNNYRKLSKIAKPFFKPKFMQGLRKKIYQKIGAEDYVATPELTETFLTLIKEDLTEYLQKIKAETLLVWGEQDSDTPIDFAQKMHSEIKKSKLVILPDAGHFSFIDQPKEFEEALVNFIGDR